MSALVLELLRVSIGAIALMLLYGAVAAVTALIDGHQRARELREYREADFWRTAHAPQLPRKRAVLP